MRHLPFHSCRSLSARAALPRIFSIGLSLLLLTTLIACQPQLSGEDEVYLATVKRQDLEFSVDSSASAAAWERARQFFVLHSRAQILRDSPTALETSPPVASDFQSFGYRILRDVSRQPHRFSVDCYTLEMGAQADADLNAQILAYYIRTGEIRDIFLSGRRR